MKLDITLWDGTTLVPYAPAKTVRGKELGGGAAILKHVGGAPTQPLAYADITTVRASAPATRTQSAWSHDFPVKGGNAGHIRVPTGSTIVILWQGLPYPVIVQVRDPSAVSEIRAARKLLSQPAPSSSAPSPAPTRPKP